METQTGPETVCIIADARGREYVIGGWPAQVLMPERLAAERSRPGAPWLIDFDCANGRAVYRAVRRHAVWAALEAELVYEEARAL